MRKGYAAVYLTVDGERYDFVNRNKSKMLAQKGRVSEAVIENAKQLGRKERVTLESHDRVTIDIVGSKGPTRCGNYEGEHKICVYPDKVKIN